MSAAAVLANPTQQNNLQLQKSYAQYLQQVNQLTGYAWQVVYTALWNTKHFSDPEIEMAKDFISSFLQQGNNPKANYQQFVQRVLLARQYISSHPGTYIPIPSQWFNTENTKGFAGTAKWFASIQQTRAAIPLYKQPIKAFAEAIHQTAQTGSAKDFHNWRSYFIQQSANSLLNLYLSTIANYYLSSK